MRRPRPTVGPRPRGLAHLFVALVLGAAVAATSASRAVAATPADLTDEGLERALALLDRLDRIRASIDADDERLEDLMERLDALAPDVDIVVEWGELGRVGARRHTPVSVRTEGGSLLGVLGAIATRLGDEYARPVVDSDGTRVLFTTRDRSAEFRMIGVYDVRDLVDTPGVLARVGVEEPAQDAATDQDEPDVRVDDLALDGVPAPEDDEAPPPAPETPTDPATQLAWLLVRHADADAWLDMGGLAGRISAHDGRIIVTAPPSVHRAVRRTLDALRRTTPTGVDVEALVIEAPADAWASVRASAAGARPRPLDVLAEPGAEIAWTGALPVADEARARVGGTSTDESVAVTLGVSLDRRPRTGDLRLAIEARFVPAGGGTPGEATTVADLPRGYGEVLLELPAPEGRTWLLVLRTTPRFAGE